MQGVLKNRMTIETRRFLPSYMMEQFETEILQPQAYNKTWTSVVEKNNTAIPDNSTSEVVLAAISASTNTTNDFFNMVEVAEKQLKKAR